MFTRALFSPYPLTSEGNLIFSARFCPPCEVRGPVPPTRACTFRFRSWATDGAELRRRRPVPSAGAPGTRSNRVARRSTLETPGGGGRAGRAPPRLCPPRSAAPQASRRLPTRGATAEAAGSTRFHGANRTHRRPRLLPSTTGGPAGRRRGRHPPPGQSSSRRRRLRKGLPPERGRSLAPAGRTITPAHNPEAGSHRHPAPDASLACAGAACAGAAAAAGVRPRHPARPEKDPPCPASTGVTSRLRRARAAVRPRFPPQRPAGCDRGPSGFSSGSVGGSPHSCQQPARRPSAATALLSARRRRNLCKCGGSPRLSEAPGCRGLRHSRGPDPARPA